MHGFSFRREGGPGLDRGRDKRVLEEEEISMKGVKINCLKTRIVGNRCEWRLMELMAVGDIIHSFEKSDKFRLLATEGETVDIKCLQERGVG